MARGRFILAMLWVVWMGCGSGESALTDTTERSAASEARGLSFSFPAVQKPKRASTQACSCYTT